MVRALQPDIILDNRLEVSGSGFGSIATDEPLEFSGDYVSPEQIIPQTGFKDSRGRGICWEACITMNDNWGYCAKDKNFKPAEMIVKKLVECVSKNGNMLLNVGPDAKGQYPGGIGGDPPGDRPLDAERIPNRSTAAAAATCRSPRTGASRAAAKRCITTSWRIRSAASRCRASARGGGVDPSRLRWFGASAARELDR